MSTTPESEASREVVRQRYAGIARDTMAETAGASGTGCCAGDRTELKSLAVKEALRMNRTRIWSVTLVVALVASLWGGPTSLSAACPPSSHCPCP